MLAVSSPPLAHRLSTVFHVTGQQSTHDQDLPLMGDAAVAITDDITSQLAQLLGRDIAQLDLEARGEAIPATVHLVSLVDRDQRRVRFVLKAQEDQSALLLYTHYLEPCDLGYLAWMADVIGDDGPSVIEQAEIDRVMASVRRVIG